MDWVSAWAGNFAIDFAITHAYLDDYCPHELSRCFFAGSITIPSLPDDYDHAYIPVRMALALSLVRVWRSQGGPFWQDALEQQGVRHVIELYRAYSQMIEAGRR